MINISKFISQYVTKRETSMFAQDIEANKEKISEEVYNKSICVIGGAGSIGSSFIRAILRFKPSKLIVIDLNENGLAELTRDLRSTYGMYVPDDYRTYTLNFADPIFARIFREEKGFDIVANFSAHKHVRSEKDKYSVQALIENNDIKAKKLMDLLCEFPPRHFFCVSTDKAANPVNIMGASKRVMEDMIMAYSKKFPVTTARFANVAFSNGSLPDGWVARIMKQQPLASPSDVRRYFVSPEESGQICMLACILGKNGEIFFPKLGEKQMLTFSSICDEYVKTLGCQKKQFSTDEEAKKFASVFATFTLSPNVKVAETAMMIWSNDAVLNLVMECDRDVLTTMFRALKRISSDHWNKSVQNMALGAISIFEQRYPRAGNEAPLAPSSKYQMFAGAEKQHTTWVLIATTAAMADFTFDLMANLNKINEQFNPNEETPMLSPLRRKGESDGSELSRFRSQPVFQELRK